MRNGSLQNFITVICAVFVAGTIWNRVSSNAAAMRETLEEIRADQRVMIKHLETLLNK